MATGIFPSSSPSQRVEDDIQRRIAALFDHGNRYGLLLAIDDDDNERAAILIANELAKRGADPRVIRTWELLTAAAMASEPSVLYGLTSVDDAYYARQRDAIALRIRGVTGPANRWPIESVIGDAAHLILAASVAHDSRLIVMGLHRHGALAQGLGENTATRVISKAEVPVLAVRRTLTRLPQRMMVATDFGAASAEAALAAASLVGRGGQILLAHVSPHSEATHGEDEAAALLWRTSTEQEFSRLSAQISAGRNIGIEWVTRVGDAAVELMIAARQFAPDAIAIARQRHSLRSRITTGSVTRRMVREGEWSMLVTPPSRQPPR